MPGRRSICATIATAALLAAPGAAGAAAPTPPDARAGEVAAVAKLLGVSKRVAADRLRLQDEVGVLEDTARRRWPRTFAGLWISKRRPFPVTVAFTEGSVVNVQELAATFDRPLLLRGVTHRRSLRDLRALQRRLIADRERARAGRLSVPGLDGARYDLDVDYARNAVVLIAERATAATSAFVRRRYGPAVLVERGRIARPDICVPDNCRFSLRAGLRADPILSTCTAGFAVRRNDNNQRNILSAGHCADTARYHGELMYGSVLAQRVSGRVDAERHSVVHNGFAARGWIFDSSQRTALKVTGTGTWSALPLGATVCKFGGTTFKSCGTVDRKDYSPGSYVTNGQDFVRVAGMCARGGDSGAPVYVNGRAEGIHSGSTAGCSAPTYAWFGHIEFAQNALNATVITSDGAPAFTSISPIRADVRVTLRFSLPVLCSSVDTSDFEVRVANINVAVLAQQCANSSESYGAESESSFNLTLGAPILPGQSVYVLLRGTVTDPAGNAVPKVARTATG